MEGIIRAWGKILTGRRPNLSIEITRECPLRCPGCYAYGDEHLGGGQTLRTLTDRKGQALIDGILEVVDRLGPLHVSLVGGEPLVRYRELDVVLPRLAERGIYVQLVTSAVRPIPVEWAGIPRLQICVSIDGLQPEHDRRRTPATYERILKHINGHRVTVHCTVTRQQTQREGYVEQFVRTWSENPNVRSIWVSLYTPQVCARCARNFQSCRCRRRCSTRISIRPIPRTSVSSRRPRPASPPTSRHALRRASSAAGQTALRADAWHRRAWPRWDATGSAASFPLMHCSAARFESAKPWTAYAARFTAP
jgi:organic radical activating enzyme